eukprot:3932753-Amphidinium_carterae.1
MVTVKKSNSQQCQDVVSIWRAWFRGIMCRDCSPLAIKLPNLGLRSGALVLNNNLAAHGADCHIDFADAGLQTPPQS